jgi:hypothetical protein
MPAKALGPLMAALPQAPNDLRLNQRLAALHTRAERFAEAGVCCRTLQSVYSEAGYPEEATRYGELADRYELRSTASSTDSVFELSPASEEEASEEITVAEEPAAPWPAAQAEPADAEFSVVAEQDNRQDQAADEVTPAVTADEPTAEPEAAPAEIDLSSEWDDAITIEAEEPVVETTETEVAHAVGDHDVPGAHAAEKPDDAESGPEKVAETIEEVRFYLEHGMPEQAVAAFEKLQTLTSDESILSALEAEIQAASHPAAEEAPAVDVSSEFTIDEPVAEITVDEVPAAASEEPVAVEEISAEPPAPAAHVEVRHVEAPPVPHVEPARPPVVEPPVEAPGVLQEFVSDLESSLGDNFLPATVSREAEPAVEHASAASATEHSQPELEPVGNAKPTTFGVPQTEVMGEFVADLEASLGDDFLKGAPVAEPAPAAPSQPVLETKPPVAAAPAQQWPAPGPAPVKPVQVPAASAAAAAASSGTPAISSQTSVAPPRQSAVAPAAATPHVSPIVPGAPAPAKSAVFGEDAGVDLAEMFGELKQDLESGTTTTEEDPETHYNLGIAFREMGLLDEAIGELQKTCQAVDRGHPFPQVIQTYTWLAQCFLDKGVPEAAIRWYQKALDAKTIDEETRTALHYELAAAYETAGDRPSALKHFMEVYGRNIDYRDVAERIKPLKS